MEQRLVHRGQGRGIRGGGPVEADETAYPAHARKTRERLGSLARGEERPVLPLLVLLALGLAVRLQPSLALNGDVIGQVAERDVGVDQVKAPSRVWDRVQGGRAADRADLENVRVVGGIAGAGVALELEPRRGHAGRCGLPDS